MNNFIFHPILNYMICLHSNIKYLNLDGKFILGQRFSCKSLYSSPGGFFGFSDTPSLVGCSTDGDLDLFSRYKKIMILVFFSVK